MEMKWILLALKQNVLCFVCILMCVRSLERLRRQMVRTLCPCVIYVSFVGNFSRMSSCNWVLEIYAGFVHTSTVLLSDKRVRALRHWPGPKTILGLFSDCLKGARL